jgi:serine/threonine protein kinase
MRITVWQTFCREALYWGRLDHPNILPFLGVDEKMFQPSFCLISPWMDNGNLMNFLEKNPDFDRLKAVPSKILYLRGVTEIWFAGH